MLRWRLSPFVHFNHVPREKNVRNHVSFESPNIGLLEFENKLNTCPLSLTFWLFWPSSRKNPDTNDISFESPNIGLLEFKKKLGMASSLGWPFPLNWKSITITKISLMLLRTELHQISHQISIATTQGFQMTYNRVSWIYWLKNRFSRFCDRD